MIFLKSNPTGTLARGSKYLADSITDLVDPSSWVVHNNLGFFNIHIYRSVLIDCDKAYVINIILHRLDYKV